MIIDHFDVGWSFRRPSEANPELVVNPDRMLSLPVSAQRFQPIAGRHPQVFAQIDGWRRESSMSPPIRPRGGNRGHSTGLLGHKAKAAAFTGLPPLPSAVRADDR
jgi:hypothetical protein